MSFYKILLVFINLLANIIIYIVSYFYYSKLVGVGVDSTRTYLTPSITVTLLVVSQPLPQFCTDEDIVDELGQRTTVILCSIVDFK